MQHDPLKELQRIQMALNTVDMGNQIDSIVDFELVYKELQSNINSLMPILTDISEAFNAIDQAKDIKALVRQIDHAMNGVQILQDGQVITPGKAGEALSALGQLADYADSLIDTDFLKTSIN